jgi:hypothetical protein
MATVINNALDIIASTLAARTKERDVIFVRHTVVSRLRGAHFTQKLIGILRVAVDCTLLPVPAHLLAQVCLALSNLMLINAGFFTDTDGVKLLKQLLLTVGSFVSRVADMLGTGTDTTMRPRGTDAANEYMMAAACKVLGDIVQRFPVTRISVVSDRPRLLTILKQHLDTRAKARSGLASRAAAAATGRGDAATLHYVACHEVAGRFVRWVALQLASEPAKRTAVLRSGLLDALFAPTDT